MKKAIFIAILIGISNLALCQSLIGPYIGIGYVTLGQRNLTNDFNIKSTGVETQIGVSYTNELSPFTSLRSSIGYSFQNFEYSNSIKDSVSTIKAQYVNVNSGLLFTLFDEGVHKVRPYGRVNIGLSILSNDRSTENLTSYTNKQIALSGMRLCGGVGAGAFVKLSEFSKFSLGVNYDRSFTEVFKDSDVRQNRIQALMELTFQL